ncbi:MAG: hypothetical protein F6K40_03080 [Okeania sp. SIO3I5]|uniref:hypothetical protein n=1 Tax=Okeania sp. SIO3I5 TaxID=2607805 RepID=UPI0013B7B2B8|nr:hypothetical protein [Okeania sp. SIO3I5]NEQ35345.1 hypothetical protein [Okeania sp. SIO3I5]
MVERVWEVWEMWEVWEVWEVGSCGKKLQNLCIFAIPQQDYQVLKKTLSSFVKSNSKFY